MYRSRSKELQQNTTIASTPSAIRVLAYAKKNTCIPVVMSICQSTTNSGRGLNSLRPPPCFPPFLLREFSSWLGIREPLTNDPRYRCFESLGSSQFSAVETTRCQFPPQRRFQTRPSLAAASARVASSEALAPARRPRGSSTEVRHESSGVQPCAQPSTGHASTPPSGNARVLPPCAGRWTRRRAADTLCIVQPWTTSPEHGTALRSVFLLRIVG